MRFLNFTLFLTLSILTTAFFYWKPASEIIVIKAIEPLIKSQELCVDEKTWLEDWKKYKIDPLTTKRETSVSFFMKQSKDNPIQVVDNYERPRIKVICDRGIEYYSAHLWDADDVFESNQIPAGYKCPYRPLSYFFLICSIALVIFRKKLFKKPPLIAHTTAGNACRVSLVLFLIGLFLVLLPFSYGVFNDAMGAVAFIGAILLLTGFICLIIYTRSASKTQNRLKDNEVLADWIIPRKEWKTFVQTTFNKELKKLIIVLSAITGFMLLSGYIVSHGEKNQGLVMIALTVICALLWTVTVFPSLWKQRPLKKGNQLVRVYPFGVQMGNKIYQWDIPAAKFEKAVFSPDPIPLITVSVKTVL